MIAASEARTGYRLGHQSSPLFYSGGRVTQFLFFLSSGLWMFVFRSFLLTIAFSVLCFLLGIFKLFNENMKIVQYQIFS